MNRFTPETPDPIDGTSAFVVKLIVGLALVAAVPAVLWVLADPAAALLTLTALGAAGLLLVGALDVAHGDGEQSC